MPAAIEITAGRHTYPPRAGERYKKLLRLFGGSFLIMPSFSCVFVPPTIEMSVDLTRGMVATGMMEAMMIMLTELFPAPAPAPAASPTTMVELPDLLASARADVDFVFCETGFTCFSFVSGSLMLTSAFSAFARGMVEDHLWLCSDTG
jgi:hypothetical protein